MTANGKEEQLRLGFLTAIEVPDRCFVGGLLVTNHFGRPLEFQCTAPVKPNATQELLYGPTLEPFVLGELIAGTLIDHSGVKPHLILTDRAAILELRHQVEQPVGLVVGAAGDADASAVVSGQFKIGRQIVRFDPDHTQDRASYSQNMARIPADADLEEPFARVREALRETLRSGA